MKADSKPLFSVVIPTLGRSVLEQTIASLRSINRSDEIEVIIVGKLDKSRFATMKTEAGSLNLRHLDISFEKGDSSEKKNAGFDAASADIVAFIDDDVVLAEDWVGQVMDCFKEDSVALMSGPALVPSDISLIGRLAGKTLASGASGYVAARYKATEEGTRSAKWSHIIGCNMAYRKNIFLKIGKFDPLFWPGEEMIAAFKVQEAGYGIVFNPKAYVYHYPRQSIVGFVRQIFGYGATRVRLIRAGVEFEPASIVPGLWVVSLLLFSFGAIFCSYSMLLLHLDMFLYCLMDIFFTLRSCLQDNKDENILLVFMIPVMHVSYGVGQLVELLRPGKDLSERNVFSK